MARLDQPIYLALLRSIFFLSIVLAIIYPISGIPLFMIWPTAQFNALISSILIHLIVDAFNIPFLCDNRINIIWVAGNTCGLIVYNVTLFKSLPSIIAISLSQVAVAQIVVSLVLVALHIFVLPAHVYNYWQARKSAEKRPFKLRDMRGVGILFGRSLWKARLIGETRGLILARGIFASSLLAGVVAFFYISIFTGAFQELQFIPTQNTRIPGATMTSDFGVTNTAIWGVTISTIIGPNLYLQYINNNTSIYATAFKVLPLPWNANISLPNLPSCVQVEPETYLEFADVGYRVAISFECPPMDTTMDAEELYSETLYNNMYLPDLLVTANFDALRIQGSNSTRLDIPFRSVQITPRISNNSALEAFKMTRPTVVVPGVNMVGMVSMEVHQIFKNPGVGTLGIFEYLESILVGQVTQLYHDPSTSPLIQRGPQLSTLHLSVVRDETEWVIIRDFKNNSFLGGFSKVGGLWTFLSGIFAAIFGSSLMRVLFGNKPISVFGFAHRWQRETIVKAYHTSYPAIREEMNISPEQRGMLRLIQDHIVDLNLIDKPDLDESSESHELTVLHNSDSSSAPLAASEV